MPSAVMSRTFWMQQLLRAPSAQMETSNGVFSLPRNSCAMLRHGMTLVRTRSDAPGFVISNSISIWSPTVRREAVTTPTCRSAAKPRSSSTAPCSTRMGSPTSFEVSSSSVSRDHSWVLLA